LKWRTKDVADGHGRRRKEFRVFDLRIMEMFLDSRVKPDPSVERSGTNGEYDQKKNNKTVTIPAAIFVAPAPPFFALTDSQGPP
jgi:hypothetical protein